jgi:hypothetical protein
MATTMTTALVGTAPRARGRAGVHDFRGTLTVKEPIAVLGDISLSNTKPDRRPRRWRPRA